MESITALFFKNASAFKAKRFNVFIETLRRFAYGFYSL